MSLPLTRRIAQAALLVAAGATPLVAAGSAFAADLVPPQTDLASSVTQLDAPSTPSTVQGAAHDLGETAGTTGAATVAAGVPAAFDATGHTVASALPDADKTLGGVTAPAAKTAAATGTLSTVAGKVAPALIDRAGPAVTEKLVPMAGGTRSASAAANPLGSLTGGLPTGGLTNGLPTSQLTKSLPGADALPLDSLTGHAGDQRLGGVPGLGSNPTDALTNLIGGLGVGGLGGAGLPI